MPGGSEHHSGSSYVRACRKAESVGRRSSRPRRPAMAIRRIEQSIQSQDQTPDPEARVLFGDFASPRLSVRLSVRPILRERSPCLSLRTQHVLAAAAAADNPATAQLLIHTSGKPTAVRWRLSSLREYGIFFFFFSESNRIDSAKRGWMALGGIRIPRRPLRPDARTGTYD